MKTMLAVSVSFLLLSGILEIKINSRDKVVGCGSLYLSSQHSEAKAVRLQEFEANQ